MLQKYIFHIDINAFFVSCHSVFNPQLKNICAVVARNNLNAIIVAANYKAKKFGVKTTMTVWQAKQLCPDLVVLTHKTEMYHIFSKYFILYIKLYFTNRIEPASIDELFADVSHLINNPQSALQLAEKIQTSIKQNLYLPCSIGIASNKFLAKMASNLKKPEGISTLYQHEIQTKLWPLSIKNIHGLGKAMWNWLQPLNLKTIGDLADINRERFKNVSIIWQNRFNDIYQKVWGYSNDEIKSLRVMKSFSAEQTLAHFNNDYAEILFVLKQLFYKVLHKLNHNYSLAKQVSVYYATEYGKNRTSHQISLSTGTNNETLLWSKIKEIWLSLHLKKPIKLIGVSLGKIKYKFNNYHQLNIDNFQSDHNSPPSNENQNKVINLINDINHQKQKPVLVLLKDYKKDDLSITKLKSFLKQIKIFHEQIK